MRSYFIISAFLFTGLLAGILIERTEPLPYRLAKKVAKNLLTTTSASTPTECDIATIERFSEPANIVIGHAYGSPGAPSALISDNLRPFLEKNKTRIRNVFFSGDIFSIPSRQRWSDLAHYMKNLDLKYFIAPGNHDVGFFDNTSRDIFNDFHHFSYPIIKYADGFIVILVDTPNNRWGLSKNDIDIIRSFNDDTKPIIVIGHHVFTREFLHISNSKVGLNKTLPSLVELGKIFENKDQNIFLISGDTGAIQNLPRTTCSRYNNIMAIVNGVGNLENDEIIAFNDKGIWRVKVYIDE